MILLKQHSATKLRKLSPLKAPARLLNGFVAASVLLHHSKASARLRGRVGNTVSNMLCEQVAKSPSHRLLHRARLIVSRYFESHHRQAHGGMLIDHREHRICN
ncbi:hypothetical protein DMENIID0001_084250 [Sergentomyia squamirostris]